MDREAAFVIKDFSSFNLTLNLFDVSNDIGNGLKLFSFFVGYFDVKVFFESHHEFNGIQRISTEISMNFASAVTLSDSTPSCSTMILLTFSSMLLSDMIFIVKVHGYYMGYTQFATPIYEFLRVIRPPRRK